MTNLNHVIRWSLRLLLLAAVCLVPVGNARAADLAIYTDSIADGWYNWSWNTTVDPLASSPVQNGSHALAVTYTSAWAGLYLHTNAPVTLSGYTALRFWIYGGGAGGQQLQVSATNGGAAYAVTAAAGVWTKVEVPLTELGSPATLADLTWQDTTGGPQPVFYLDEVVLVAGSTPPPPTGTGPDLSVDVAAGRHPISPDIYGMNFADETLAADLRLPVDRRGGNSTSRYNWQNDTYNTGSDWYFENIPADNPEPKLLPDGSAADRFVAQDRRTGTRSILTVPLLGWVAKQRPVGHPYDCGFGVALYGAQDSVDPWDTNCGNGVHNGTNLTGNNPADTSIATTTGFVTDWIAHLKGRYGSAAGGGVAYYNLDNEPMLWNSTHRDVHPSPTTYDELRDRTYLYAAAVKTADATAQTLGPVLWGWCAYFYSASDGCSSGADAAAHGGTPFVPWYLQQMQAYQQLHGVRILDYLDLHYYPQAAGVSLTTAGSTTTQALRLRSTRSLWDPAYTDESWIGAAVQLIPRMRGWVTANYPGTKLAVTEYNWGGLEHINGALAQADVLGIFGREGVDLATLWGAPTYFQPGAYAFRIYRNYDGAGHGFGETAVQAASDDQGQLAVYGAQRSTDSALTLVVINKSTANLTSTVSLAGFPASVTAAVYRYSTASPTAIEHEADQAIAGTSFSAQFPASSISLLELLPRTATLDVTPSGAGSVTSSPAGIDCRSGSAAGCSGGFVEEVVIALTASPDAGQLFTGWSGACNGRGGCSVTMSGPRSVGAAFAPAVSAIGPARYASLQDAYDAATSGDLVKSLAGTYTGSLTADRSVALTVTGGFDAGFSTGAGTTTLQGTVTVRKGCLTLGRLVIR